MNYDQLVYSPLPPTLFPEKKKINIIHDEAS